MTISFITNGTLSNGAIVVSALGVIASIVALIINFIKHNKFRNDNEQSRVIRWLEYKVKEKDKKLTLLSNEYDILEKKFYDQVRIVTLLESSSFNVPFSYWLKNINLEIDYINRYYETEFKVNLSDLVGKTNHDYLPKDLADKSTITDRKVLEGKEVLIDIDNEIKSYLVIKWRRYSNNILIGVAGLAIKLDEHNRDELIRNVNNLI